MSLKSFLIVGCASLFLASCQSSSLSENLISEEPVILEQTNSGKILKQLPPAEQRIVVAIYEFQDQTGQHKANDVLAEFSRAVTQGGVSILKKALLDAGNHRWFTVLERGGLNNLLQERKIIRDTRSQYVGADGQPLPDIPPLLYAGMLIEGGIISYETNTVTGGLGARYLGVGGDTQYRRDIVTVYLRATNVQTGEVLISVDASKTIYSAAMRGGIFKFVSFDELLEVETGFSVNEPPQFAVRQATESAVYALIMEGVEQGLWDFADKAAGKKAITAYRARRDGSTIEPDEQGNPVPSAKKKQPRSEKAIQESTRGNNENTDDDTPVLPLPASLANTEGDISQPSQIPYGSAVKPEILSGLNTEAQTIQQRTAPDSAMVENQRTRYSDEVLRSYIRHISSWVWRKNRQTPESDRMTGSAKVQIRINRKGELQEHWLVSSTGSSTSDVIALEMVKRASPFPQIPADYYPERALHEFIIHITGRN